MKKVGDFIISEIYFSYILTTQENFVDFVLFLLADMNIMVKLEQGTI